MPVRKLPSKKLPGKLSGRSRPSRKARMSALPPHIRVPIKGRAPLAALMAAALMAPIAIWACRKFLNNKQD